MSGSSSKSLVIPLVILGCLYVLSVVFFHFVEGWNYIDAAYYTTVTITTVGYGDFVPQTNFGKMGAIILIFCGVSIAFYIITHLGTLRERTIDPVVQRRLDILRNLTALQTGEMQKSEIKKIRKKIDDNSHTI